MWVNNVKMMFNWRILRENAAFLAHVSQQISVRTEILPDMLKGNAYAGSLQFLLVMLNKNTFLSLETKSAVKTCFIFLDWLE
jgi:hypothetical protein